MIELRSFDIFQTPAYDVVEPKPVGGALTITSLILCLTFLLSEMGSYRKGYLKENVFLEHSSEQKRVEVDLDISVDNIPCKHVSLDIQDHLGRYEIDEHDTKTLRKEPYHKTGGCRFRGQLFVNKVAGNFHFTPRGDHSNRTIEHTIHDLRFGDYISSDIIDVLKIKSFESLVAKERYAPQGKTHDYLIKLVKTEVYDADVDEHFYPYQYTYTHRTFVGHYKGKPTPPKVYFRMDWSPLTMKFTRKHTSLGVFLTRHLAILGGMFAVIKMLYCSYFVAKDTMKSL